MNTTEEKKVHTVSITNECTCVEVDENGDEMLGEYGETIPSRNCHGWCWEDVVQSMGEWLKPMIVKNETGWWKVQSLRLWDGNHSFYFFVDPVNDPNNYTEYTKQVQKIIDAMTVNSSWTMYLSGRFNDHDEFFYALNDDGHFEYSLSHHDAPTGSSSVLIPMTEDELVAVGLYEE